MAAVVARACSRCHAKKIKCDGSAECRNCLAAGASCEPHTRVRRSERAQDLQRRVQWLQSEINSILHLDCELIETGASLQSLIDPTRAAGPGVCPEQRPPALDTTERASAGIPGSREAVSSTVDESQSPELSSLALNATGEARYLGPSSGMFFTKFVTSLAQSTEPAGPFVRRRTSFPARQSSSDNCSSGETTDNASVLSSEDVRLLRRSYELWIMPMYPLFDREGLLDVIGPSPSGHDASARPPDRTPEEQTIFYLVMALGAVNVSNTMNHLKLPVTAGKALPAASTFHERAVLLLERHIHGFPPSLALVQILLLLCIYSSYRPSHYAQWQLAGLAIRVAIQLGLHSSHADGRLLEQDVQRRRQAFWTAYIIEVSLAYNLGRPPSLADNHITANLPQVSEGLELAVHHVKHRQIQSKIIAAIYSQPTSGQNAVEPEQVILDRLQQALDMWKATLLELYSQQTDQAYPLAFWERLYYGTSFVLHRSSVLCRQPSAKSAKWCIQAAAAYVEALSNALRKSRMPLHWMLVQGVLFAGITMLVTARTNARSLLEHVGASFVLVDIPNYTRRFSACIAVMTDRWDEDLLSKLEAQFENLASETLSHITMMLTAAMDPAVAQNVPLPTRTDIDASAPGASGFTIIPPQSNFGVEAPVDWNNWYDIDQWSEGDNGFWDIFSLQSGFDVSDPWPQIQ